LLTDLFGSEYQQAAVGPSDRSMALNRHENSLQKLCKLPPDVLATLDIGAINLLCAAGLPKAENLNIADLVVKLDDWAEQIRRETERNYVMFLKEPAQFKSSQAYFCVACMINILGTQFGVCYNPKWRHITPDKPIPDDFGADANDGFIHPILEGVGGVCGSLPFFYVAIGRRLGYPLRIFKVVQHLVVRWDDPDGTKWLHPDRFNIEATAPGVHCLSDIEYRKWPKDMPQELIDAGVYLKSLTPQEELAECMATRGHIWKKNGYLTKASGCFRAAWDLAPHNSMFRDNCRHMQALIAELNSEPQGFINQPHPMSYEASLREQQIKPSILAAVLDRTPTLSQRTFGDRIKVAIGTSIAQLPPETRVEFVPDELATWPPRGRAVRLAPGQSANDLNLPVDIHVEYVPPQQADFPPAHMTQHLPQLPAMATGRTVLTPPRHSTIHTNLGQPPEEYCRSLPNDADKQETRLPADRPSLTGLPRPVPKPIPFRPSMPKVAPLLPANPAES
jgi:hypothetical protein